jgi:transcriptional regulator with XRE-family HTH domain
MKKITKGRVPLSQIVGKNIKTGRKIKGLTQSQLAQEIGVEVETVSRYERGLLAPSFPQLEKICTALAIPAWMIFSDGDNVPDTQAMCIAEILKGLSAREIEFVVSYVQLYAEYHRRH